MSNSVGATVGGQNEDDNSKSVEELLRELADLNHNDEAISIDWLAQMLRDIRECICRGEGQQQTHPISKWAAEDIKSWANDLKQQRQTRELPELLAVACRACMLASGYCPRDAQLISILLMLSPPEAGLRGHLQQIATGEGKTAIVALFVVVKALRDRVKVDVVTSSNTLARRDAKDLKTFYDMFGLTVDHCTSGFSSLYKKCYAADILYGDIGSFEFDILYHEFKSGNVRGTPPRPFECIVIDEVDCILVDGMKQIFKLSFHIPPMEYLEGILTRYWARFERFRATFETDFGIFVEELEALLTNQINGNGEENDELLVIPPHLHAFALKQIPKWMHSLKKAVRMNEDCEYVIREGAVIPVDYRNTGTQHRNTSWSNGLQQFLQLKHGLRMDPEAVVTSFITTPGLINRYKEIYGLSGTLGSNYEHSFLKDHYKADIRLLPTYKPSQLETMNLIIENDLQSWIDKICENILVQVTMCKRAALIICLTNAKVKQLSTVVESKFPGIKILKYTDDDEHFPTEFVGPMDVVLSTNYAARGTDIKTSAELEAKGGLHVIVTFMPRNSRVERQAFGRTARQGKKGTAQLILNKCDLDKDLVNQDVDNQPQLEAMDSIIVNDQQSWIAKICENILVQVTMCKRAALIICLTNAKVKQLSTVVESKFPGIKILKYTDDDEHFPTEFVGPMDVVLSTNYAARGTDIKTSAELEAKGGLHVIVTFIPKNSRVGRQAFGRTARQGQKGTTQFIINECDMDEDLFDHNMDILAKRDKWVEQTFEMSKNEGLPKLLVRERLFKKFSTFIGEMRKSTANAVGGNVEILAQIEEHWGFWLQEKVVMRGRNAPLPSEAVLNSELDAFIVEERRKASPPPRRPPPEEFFYPFGPASLFVPLVDNFFGSFSPPFLGLSIFTNPCYLVLKGYRLDYGYAIAHLEKAIELDKNESGFVVPARYYMALALVKKGDCISVDDRKVRVEYQNEAAEHLKKANKLINEKLIPWLSKGVKPNGEGNAQNMALCQQIDNKVQLLRQLSEQCDKWLDFIAKCPAGQFCKFKGWIKPDPYKKLPQMEVTEFGNFGVWEFYELEYAKPPNSWAEIGLITFFGAVQIGCGVIFVWAGKQELAEKCFESGFNDIVDAVKAISGDTVISWDKYAIDKFLTYCPLLTDKLKEYLFEKTGIPVRDLNDIEWMLHQDIKVLSGEKPEGRIQHELGNDECWDMVKEGISRSMSTGVQEMFGYGNGFTKNLVEVLAKVFTNLCTAKLAEIADELIANPYQSNANGSGAGASNQSNANGGGAGASNQSNANGGGAGASNQSNANGGGAGASNQSNANGGGAGASNQSNANGGGAGASNQSNANGGGAGASNQSNANGGGAGASNQSNANGGGAGASNQSNANGGGAGASNQSNANGGGAGASNQSNANGGGAGASNQSNANGGGAGASNQSNANGGGAGASNQSNANGGGAGASNQSNANGGGAGASNQSNANGGGAGASNQSNANGGGAGASNQSNANGGGAGASNQSNANGGGAGASNQSNANGGGAGASNQSNANGGGAGASNQSNANGGGAGASNQSNANGGGAGASNQSNANGGGAGASNQSNANGGGAGASNQSNANGGGAGASNQSNANGGGAGASNQSNANGGGAGASNQSNANGGGAGASNQSNANGGGAGASNQSNANGGGAGASNQSNANGGGAGASNQSNANGGGAGASNQSNANGGGAGASNQSNANGGGAGASNQSNANGGGAGASNQSNANGGGAGASNQSNANGGGAGASNQSNANGGGAGASNQSNANGGGAGASNQSNANGGGAGASNQSNANGGGAGASNQSNANGGGAGASNQSNANGGGAGASNQSNANGGGAGASNQSNANGGGAGASNQSNANGGGAGIESSNANGGGAGASNQSNANGGGAGASNQSNANGGGAGASNQSNANGGGAGASNQSNANGGGTGASNQSNPNGGGSGASNQPTDNDVPKLAINCEYVGIGPSGEEDMLARVSIVDADEHTVYDKYVKPTQPIVDYRTEASGINAGDLEPGVPFAQVQSEVKKLISGNILIGHSLDKDLRYLSLIHPPKLIRDTAKFKLLRKGLDDPEKIPSLQELALQLLKEPIQQGEHDSILDAKIALRIYLKCREMWEKWVKALYI